MGRGALVPACDYFQRLVPKEKGRTWVQAIGALEHRSDARDGTNVGKGIEVGNRQLM